MKISLRFKFLFSYCIIILAMLILLNTYGNDLMYDRIQSQAETHLYNEADQVARQYLTNTYLVNSSIPTLRKQFASIQTLTDVRIWVANPDGKILIDSDLKLNKEGYNINESDSSFLSNQSIMNVTLDTLLDDPSICVIYPLTSSMETQAYIIMSTTTEGMHQKATNYMDTIIICYMLLSLIILAIMIYLYLQTVIPLRAMEKAAREYADGHFDYPMVKIPGHDQSNLAASIRYLADKMSDTNDYQKKFIANVSHDFRSPLTSIKGYAEAMADGTIPPEMQGKYLDIILFETERLTKLTNNLLSLSQFENNGVPLEISTFNINQELKRCLASFEQRCTQKHISLELTFDAKDLMVDADQSKIEQVIQNLLDNAIKFSPNDSIIEIHTNERNQKVFVSVKDHGIGIPKDSLGKVWNRFYKTDLSRGKDKKGTGLGLSITKEIIEAHGENINVISTEGVGTEFIFTLPEHIELD